LKIVLAGKEYWNNRYLHGKTGWDIGSVSTPIKDWLDGQANKHIKVLIPGAGNGYEAEYAFNNGFSNITVLDIAPEPLNNIKNRVPNFPENNLLLQDFFEHKGQYDVIVEQTFFCAIDPILRKKYVSKANELLSPEGRIVGLLFNIPFQDLSRPFGGDEKEYRALFKPSFSIKHLALASNSIKPRSGNEFWVEFIKK